MTTQKCTADTTRNTMIVFGHWKRYQCFSGNGHDNSPRFNTDLIYSIFGNFQPLFLNLNKKSPPAPISGCPVFARQKGQPRRTGYPRKTSQRTAEHCPRLCWASCLCSLSLLWMSCLCSLLSVSALDVLPLFASALCLCSGCPASVSCLCFLSLLWVSCPSPCPSLRFTLRVPFQSGVCHNGRVLHYDERQSS